MFARRLIALLALLGTHAMSARADEPSATTDGLAPPVTTSHAAALSAAPPPPAVPPPPVVAPSAVQAAPSVSPSAAAATTTPQLPVAPAPIPRPEPAPVVSERPGPAQGTADRIQERQPMDNYAFGLKIGYASVGTGKFNNPVYVQGASSLSAAQLAQYGLANIKGCSPVEKECHTQARRGVHISLPIQLGGSIFGIRLEPYMTLAPAGNAYGLYFGPTFQFHVRDSLYIGFGLGVQAAWVKADPWKYAGDLYARVPIEMTYYVLDDLALTLEFGIGGGASAYYRQLKNIVNPVTGRTIANLSDVAFGVGKIWDLSLGVRFP